MASSAWYDITVQCFYSISLQMCSVWCMHVYVYIYTCKCNKYVANHDSNRVLLTALRNTQEEHFKIIISSKRYCHMKQKNVRVSHPRSECVLKWTTIRDIKCLSANIAFTSINVCFTVIKLNWKILNMREHLCRLITLIFVHTIQFDENDWKSSRCF